LRECLNILQNKQPLSWKTFHVRSLLGGVLLGQKLYAEAQPLVVEGYEGLKSHQAEIPRLFARHFISEAGERILRLYDAWGPPEEAARWRAKLSEEGKSTSTRDGHSRSMAVPGGSQGGAHPDHR
jgi:eukaryotic-like serine/threonine-protein kinase